MNSAIYHILILVVIYSIFLLNKRINRSKSNFDNLDLLMIPQIFIDMRREEDYEQLYLKLKFFPKKNQDLFILKDINHLKEGF
jgi:hypothetical protein